MTASAGAPTAPVRTLVVKIGSSSVTTASGGVDHTAIEKVAAEVAAAIAGGDRVVVVSSGAIAAGWSASRPNAPARPTSPPSRQSPPSVSTG